MKSKKTTNRRLYHTTRGNIDGRVHKGLEKLFYEQHAQQPTAHTRKLFSTRQCHPDQCLEGCECWCQSALLGKLTEFDRLQAPGRKSSYPSCTHVKLASSHSMAWSMSSAVPSMIQERAGCALIREWRHDLTTSLSFPLLGSTENEGKLMVSALGPIETRTHGEATARDEHPLHPLPCALVAALRRAGQHRRYPALHAARPPWQTQIGRAHV